MENENRLAFENGVAPFELNYPFVYPPARQNAPEIFRNMGWAPYPRVTADEPAHVTIGGIDLGVSRVLHPQARGLSGYPVPAGTGQPDPQRRRGRASAGADRRVPEPPDQFREQYPFYQAIYESLEQASVRPKTPAYQSVSIVIAATLSPPSGIDPRGDVDELRSAISDALQSKGLIP